MQAGLRSELEIATDEMERAQQRLATLEREKDILVQGTSSPTAAQAAKKAPANKLVEESLRNELQNQVFFAPIKTFCNANLSCELSHEVSPSEPVSWKSRCPFQSASADAGAIKVEKQVAEPALFTTFNVIYRVKLWKKTQAGRCRIWSLLQTIAVLHSSTLLVTWHLGKKQKIQSSMSQHKRMKSMLPSPANTWGGKSACCALSLHT